MCAELHTAHRGTRHFCKRGYCSALTPLPRACGDACDAAGTVLLRSGRTSSDTPTAAGVDGLPLRRAALRSALLGAVPAGCVHWGKDVTAFSEQDDGVTLHLAGVLCVRCARVSDGGAVELLGQAGTAAPTTVLTGASLNAVNCSMLLDQTAPTCSVIYWWARTGRGQSWARWCMASLRCVLV